ncbi:HAD family hydrolase [Coralliovum pocilloporae]|uniref:HAD family hydrolase n=1 Tax=Coralliovum pocilloporae TaxID=3066369 RepID=UPI003306DFB1
MLIIFDADGVLLDSEIVAAKVETEAFRQHGFDRDPQDFVREFAGLPGSEIKSRIEEELGKNLPDDLLDQIERTIDERLAKDVKAIEGVEDMLDSLDDPRCVCSNSPTERLEATFRKTALFDRFRPYIFSAISIEDVEPKPAPDIFLHAARELETDPGDCIVIEDSVHGVAGAIAAGMRVIGFVGGSHSFTGHSELLMEAGAETVARRLSEIAPIIEAMKVWDGRDL